MFSILSDIGNSLKAIWSFITWFIDFLTISISFIPQPFLGITLIFLTIFIASFIYKVVNR